MKLEEGMYVRIEKGKISKIEFIFSQLYEENNIIIATFRLENGDTLTYPDDKFKISKNIIDLIEIGDFVNKLLVTRICFDEETNKKYLNLYGSISEWEEADIKSIVTKEQFESMVYEVE